MNKETLGQITRYYIYHSKGTGHDINNEPADDIAITEAKTKSQAIKNFKKYYVDVNPKNVNLIDLYKKEFAQNMHIVNGY